MPNIQGLPKDFDITKLSSLARGDPRATHMARIMQSHQNLTNLRKRTDRRNQHLQPEIGEIVEEKWQFETTIDDVQLQCIAKGMDPGEVFIHKLNFVSGENSIGQQSRRSHDVRTFHTINFASGRAVLKHTGLDENGALVLAYPTINLENFDVSISSNSPNSVDKTSTKGDIDTVLKCVLSVDDFNSDLPVYKFNHKRLEQTLEKWVVAGARCKFINDAAELPKLIQKSCPVM